MSWFLVRKEFSKNIYIIHTIYIYIYMNTKGFLLCLIKAWERTSKEEELDKLGNTEYEIENVKQTR